MAQRRQYWKENNEKIIEDVNEKVNIQLFYLIKELNKIKNKQTNKELTRTFDKEGNINHKQKKLIISMRRLLQDKPNLVVKGQQKFNAE